MGTERYASYKITAVEVEYLSRKKPGVLIEFPAWYEGVIDSDILEKMNEWCIRNNCGHRIGYDDFIFNREQQRTMFILRWS